MVEAMPRRENTTILSGDGKTYFFTVRNGRRSQAVIGRMYDPITKKEGPFAAYNYIKGALVKISPIRISTRNRK